MSTPERRRLYRVRPTDSEAYAVQLHLDGQATSAELIDLSAGGAGVRSAVPIAVALGAPLTLLLRGPDVTLELPGVVASKVDMDTGCRIGLQFAEEIDSSLDLPIALRSLLNRRRALRVAPAEAVEVMIRPHDEDGEPSMGLLIDLSVTGLSVWLDGAAHPMETGSRLLLSFEVADGVPLDVVGVLRNAANGAGPRTRCTFEIDPEETTGFAEQRRVLARFIAERQQALSKRR